MAEAMIQAKRMASRYPAATTSMDGCQHARVSSSSWVTCRASRGITVRPEGDGHAFTFDARALREGEMPDDLLAWLEPRMPEEGALVSYDNRGSVPKRLAAIAPAEHYPRIAAPAAETSARWRDLPRAYTLHRRQAVSPAMPCLCGSDGMATCQAELPTCFLPDPKGRRYGTGTAPLR